MRRRASLLDVLERFGNLLPHPAVIFVYLIVFLFVGSFVASWFELSVIDPRDVNQQIAIVNLLSMEQFLKFSSSLVHNFATFPPLGVVLIAMLGISIAEASGFLGAVIKMVILRTPKQLIVPVVVLAGVMSNLASDVGYVVLIPLAAIVFCSIGRHPLAGLSAAFAGVSGGYSANLLIGTVDPILSGITQQAAALLDPSYVVGVEANYFFMFVSTFLIVGIGTAVNTYIIEPRLGPYEQEGQVNKEQLSQKEQRGVIFALLAMVLYVFLLCLLLYPQDSLLRNPANGSLVGSPFLKSIIFYVFFLFAIPGIVYGILTKHFSSSALVIDAMVGGMRRMSGVLVIIFFASQFLFLFGLSNIGPFLAIKGANFLQSLELHKGVVLLLFVGVCAFINLMIASASAQWALISPIFVPMLMLLGYSPELIQAAYRIGDSTTNIITPLLAYLPVILSVAMQYQKDIGIGTMISLMLPYCLSFLVGWSLLLYIWVFVFDWPLGPGVSNFLG